MSDYFFDKVCIRLASALSAQRGGRIRVRSSGVDKNKTKNPKNFISVNKNHLPSQFALSWYWELIVLLVLQTSVVSSRLDQVCINTR